MANGKAYEQLVQEVYQALVDQGSVHTIDVQHDVILRGKSGAPHQVDVFWEFEVAGVKYATCIECKDHKNPVKKSVVATLIGILDDLPFVATGVVAARSGFQSGAITLATAKGLRLVEVQYVLREIEFTIHFSAPDFRNLTMEFDRKQAAEQVKRAGRDTFQIKFEGKPDELMLCDVDGNPTRSMHQLLNAMDTSNDGPVTVELTEDFVPTEIGPIRIASVAFDLKVHRFTNKTTVGGDEYARAIIQDVVENRAQYLHTDGSVSESNRNP